MAAHQEGPAFGNLVGAAAQDLLRNVFGQVFGEAHDVQRCDGLGAHRIDVRDGIRCCNGAELVRVVCYGCEEVEREHDSLLVADLQHRTVIARVEAQHQFRVDRRCDVLENFL